MFEGRKRCDHLRLPHLRSDDGDGRDHPDMAMIGAVTRSIGILELSLTPARGVPVPGHVIVEVVGEDGERLRRDQHPDGQEGDESEATSGGKGRHRH